MIDPNKSVVFTSHALARLKESQLTTEQAVEYFTQSVPEILPKDLRQKKRDRYGDDSQKDIQITRHGTVIFVYREKAYCYRVVTVYNQLQSLR